MNSNLLNLLLIGGIIISLFLSSCSKDDEPTPDDNTNKKQTTFSIDGADKNATVKVKEYNSSFSVEINSDDKNYNISTTAKEIGSYSVNPSSKSMNTDLYFNISFSGNCENSEVLSNSTFEITSISPNFEAIFSISIVCGLDTILISADLIETVEITEETTGIFTDSRDEKTYKWVKIGEQTWMAENLAFKVDTGGCWAYDNNETNALTYGYLYNWDVAMLVAPQGWHIPTDSEWKTLEIYLGMSQDDADIVGCRGNNQGSQLAGNEGLWSDDDLDQNVNFGTSGFLALPSGARNYDDGVFYRKGNLSVWWSNTDDDVNVYSRGLDDSATCVMRSGDNKLYGFSVRCIKN